MPNNRNKAVRCECESCRECRTQGVDWRVYDTFRVKKSLKEEIDNTHRLIRNLKQRKGYNQDGELQKIATILEALLERMRQHLRVFDIQNGKYCQEGS